MQTARIVAEQHSEGGVPVQAWVDLRGRNELDGSVPQRERLRRHSGPRERCGARPFALNE